MSVHPFSPIDRCLGWEVRFHTAGRRTSACPAGQCTGHQDTHPLWGTPSHRRPRAAMPMTQQHLPAPASHTAACRQQGSGQRLVQRPRQRGRPARCSRGASTERQAVGQSDSCSPHRRLPEQTRQRVARPTQQLHSALGDNGKAETAAAAAGSSKGFGAEAAQ